MTPGKIFVIDYSFLSFAKNISKNLSSKHSYKICDHSKQSASNALKTSSKIVIKKTAKTAGDLFGNKINDIIARVSKTLPQNNLETNEQIHKEKYISSVLQKKSIDDLKLKEVFNNNI